MLFGFAAHDAGEQRRFDVVRGDFRKNDAQRIDENLLSPLESLAHGLPRHLFGSDEGEPAEEALLLDTRRDRGTCRHRTRTNH